LVINTSLVFVLITFLTDPTGEGVIEVLEDFNALAIAVQLI
jgi:hypothetical protein